MRVLALTHGPDVRTEVLGEEVVHRGHALEEVDVPGGARPSRPLAEYDAALVMGGAMHPVEDEAHPWLPRELDDLRALTEAGVPWLGVCLGSQLAARALGGSVGPAEPPEIGWIEVETTPAARGDALFSALPVRFVGCVWHSYTFEPPPGAVALAHTVHPQAFRFGDRVWAVQFHPEVREAQLARWLADEPDAPVDAEAFLAETRRRIGGWNAFGRRVAGLFLDAAEALPR